VFKAFQSRDIIRRLQSRPGGLHHSALILLAVSFAADLFPLGVLVGTSLAWIITRLTLESIAAVVLVTWMWIVWNVLDHSLMKWKVSNFTVVRTVLILSTTAMIVLNVVPHSNSTKGHSFGWPFRFLYGQWSFSPMAGTIDVAYMLIVVALLLAIADRARAIPVPPADAVTAPPTHLS
jgi:hypothetical protein